MPKRKTGFTPEEIQKVLADLEDEIFPDCDSDCELENEEDNLDQSPLNSSSEVEYEVISEEQNKIVWDDPQLTHKVTILQEIM
ncbi:hypothetical protein TNCV_2573241 [Trichonephila clavipes]|nr:hypothetical protein TNCV_2573241 [Trichonephila clavipes]